MVGDPLRLVRGHRAVSRCQVVRHRLVEVQQANLLHAIYDRITVEGRRSCPVRLTPSAYAHGFLLVLPQGLFWRARRPRTRRNDKRRAGVVCRGRRESSQGPRSLFQAKSLAPVLRRRPLTIYTVQGIIADRWHGPGLGRPWVDSIKGSRVHNMKELRPKFGSIRILFVFDPRRMAILLVGGDETDRWDEWYRDNVPSRSASTTST